MDINNLKGLVEAYHQVHTPEQLDEQGYTPGRSKAADAQVAKNRAALGNTLLYGNSQGRTPSKPTAQQQMRQKIQANRPSATKPAAAPAAKPATPAPTPAAKPAPTPAAKPAPTPAAKPAATPTQAAKVAPTAAAKPAADKPSSMDQWAKANPRLAQAQKIKQQGGSRAEVNKSLYNKGTAAAGSTPTVVKAGFDLFDLVKDYLLDGGYAETLEEAEWMMANLIDEEAIDIILEAMCDDEDEEEMKKGKKSKKEEDEDEEEEEDIDEGVSGDVAARAQKLANQRKGQTPERKKMYQGLADKASARERGPFKGGTSRQGMTPAERTRSREAAAYQADFHGGSATYGKGSLPKGKKLERQRARGVSERFEAWLDEALTGERYKKALKKGKMYSRMHSADPEKRPTRGGRGGKQNDFGSPDRGGGHKSMRRRGMEVPQGDD